MSSLPELLRTSELVVLLVLHKLLHQLARATETTETMGEREEADASRGLRWLLCVWLTLQIDSFFTTISTQACMRCAFPLNITIVSTLRPDIPVCFHLI